MYVCVCIRMTILCGQDQDKASVCFLYFILSFLFSFSMYLCSPLICLALIIPAFNICLHL